MTSDQLVSSILAREGWPKVTELASDRGGLTRGGVTYTHYNRWRQSHGERPLTRDEFIVITEHEARTFLEDSFIRPFAFVTDERIFEALTDWSVNAGPNDPARALQTALAARGHYKGANDGILGPQTKGAWIVCALSADDRETLLFEIVKARIEFHFDRGFDVDVRAFIKSNQTTQLRNLHGWCLRALDSLNPSENRS